MSAQPIGVFSMTASEQLCVSLPNNACRELATIVTCTMHGLRHAPGSNHVWVSFLGVFTFSFVISKINLQSSDETTQLCRALFPIVPFLFRGFSPPLSLLSRSFFRGFYPSQRNLSAKVIIIMQTSAKKANYY